MPEAGIRAALSGLGVKALLLWAGLLTAAVAQPAPAAPARWQAVPHQAGSGQVWVRRGTGEAGARQLADQALPSLAGALLDRAPRVLGGMVARDDSGAFLSFAGHRQGVLVQGVLLVQAAAQRHTVTVALDEPSRLAQSGPRLLAAADGAGASPAAATAPSPYRNLSWQRQSFGTGQLELPQGWRVVGQHQGAVDIIGPQGEALSLGGAAPITTPQVAQMMAAGGMQVQTFVAPATGDPVAAFRAVQPQVERFVASQGAPVVRMTGVRESERIPFGSFNAALVASEGIGSVGNRPYRKLSLVAVGGVMANGSWLYYNSEVYAPTELYPHALPVMLRIWNSWSVDKSVLMERMVAAAKSLRETHDILRSTHAEREASQDRLSTAWGHHLRGTVVVRDSDTGRQSTEWLYQPGPAPQGVGLEHQRHMDTVLRDANAAAGYERWQVIRP